MVNGLLLKLSLKEILYYLILKKQIQGLIIQSIIQYQISELIKTLLILKNILNSKKKNMVNGLLLKQTQSLNQTPNQNLIQKESNLLLKLNLKESHYYLRYFPQRQVQVTQLIIQYQISVLIVIFKKLKKARNQLKLSQVKN